MEENFQGDVEEKILELRKETEKLFSSSSLLFIKLEPLSNLSLKKAFPSFVNTIILDKLYNMYNLNQNESYNRLFSWLIDKKNSFTSVLENVQQQEPSMMIHFSRNYSLPFEL